ncbi:ABC transporter permease [Mycolicibacterium hippocampi]|uniref:Putative ABC transporter, permease n=1 Tax=Mycolicibacterium hippocampi TaxID=659824 RepID=A0A7I9ZN39_9MYCO|nr:ABC transporter permease [Mycolicibacterium hippocampi]GFH02068.1 putative ABC transporter, permease [Mycolicibacterium hippocampi]
MTSTAVAPIAPGTFVPAPGAVPVARTVIRLSWLEFKLFARNGEQIVVNLIIPVTALLALILLPVGDLGADRPAVVVPAVMAAAIISSAFTGQSIAIAFDRKYGAMKRVGATCAPRWAIVVSKSVAVSGVIAAQLTILGAIGLLVGWSPAATEIFNMAVIAAAGASCFSALGLLLGGALRAELVLPLANVLWLIQLGMVVNGTYTPTASPADVLVDFSPAGALTSGMTSTSIASQEHALLVLAIWTIAAGCLAKRWFRFT